MFLSRIKLLVYVGVILLTLSSCASISGGESSGRATPKQDEAWNNVPKPYVDGLKAAQKGRPKQALAFFEQSIKTVPEFAPAYTNMGLQQLRLKKRSAAQTSLQKAIELNPKDAISYNHLGVIARLNGDFDTAKKMYNKSIELNSNYAIAHLNLGILLDLYLYELEPALLHYEKYQSMISKKDGTIAKWIVDLKRRISKSKKQ